MIIKMKRADADGWLYIDAVRDPVVSRVRFTSTRPIEVGCTGRDFPILMDLDETADPENFLRVNLDMEQAKRKQNALCDLVAKASDRAHRAAILGDQRTDPHAWLISFHDVDGSMRQVLTDQDTYLMSESGQTLDKYKGPWVLLSSPVKGPDGVIPKPMPKTGEKVAVGGDPKEEHKNTSPEDVKDYFGTKPSPSEALKAEKEGPGHSMLPGDKD